MIKFGGLICDVCRTVIAKSISEDYLPPVYGRTTKSGKPLHFCSVACADKDKKGINPRGTHTSS